jgi:hypothetical protein
MVYFTQRETESDRERQRATERQIATDIRSRRGYLTYLDFTVGDGVDEGGIPGVGDGLGPCHEGGCVVVDVPVPGGGGGWRVRIEEGVLLY